MDRVRESITATAIRDLNQAAIDHGKWQAVGNSKLCNVAHDRIMKALDELHRTPNRGDCALLDLLQYPDDSVRT